VLEAKEHGEENRHPIVEAEDYRYVLEMHSEITWVV
jgi:hypothetical protein